MDAAIVIPEAWYTGCRSLREALAGRLDAQTTIAAKDLVWTLLQRLRHHQSFADLRTEFAASARWLRVMRPFCRTDDAVRQIVLAAFAARLMELLWGRDLEALERLPRPLLSEFVVAD